MTNNLCADTDVRYCPQSLCAITYVLITGIDGIASEICEGMLKIGGLLIKTFGAKRERRVNEERGKRPRAEVRLAGGLIKVV